MKFEHKREEVARVTALESELPPLVPVERTEARFALKRWTAKANGYFFTIASFVYM